MYKIINYLIKLFNLKRTTETFTFYIPAPNNKRSIGYREKQFDKISYQFFKNGYKLIDTKVVSQNHPQQSGFWIMFIVKPSMFNKLPDFDFPEIKDNTEKVHHFDLNSKQLKNLEIE